MKQLCGLILSLFLLFIPGKGNSQENPVYPSINVEQASLTRSESQSRMSSVKVLTDRGYGSGVFVQIERQKVVFTAHHVIEGAETVRVQSENSVFQGEVIYSDKENDFAVIAVSENHEIPAMRLRLRTGSLESMIGTSVHYSGYPAHHSLLTIRGTIAGMDRGCYILHSYGWMGASGSGVFDENGRLVGILTAIDFSTSGPAPQLIESIVWIIPISNINMSSIESAIRERL
tara:strand:+ start:1327 stop:2019 length:693 start_codon:yes stop_codon:yes gene_type:complete